MNLFDTPSQHGAEPFKKMVSLCDAWQDKQVPFSAVVSWSEQMGVTTADISSEYDCDESLVDFWKTGHAVPAELIAQDLVFKLHDKAIRTISGDAPNLALI